MERVYSRINWQNEPSINTPINDINLNKMDAAIYTIDGRVVGFDTTKANQSDLLECVKQVDYNTTTGVFTFTWQNGTTQTIDLNIEKIPVSFSMDEHGVITMTTADGTQYTADVGALIKTYTFADSTVIDFTVTTDASGNKTVSADIIDGSITDDKMQPNYLADITAQASAAAASAADSEDEALVSEGFAVGEQNGVPVPSTSPYYHNNAKYYSEQSGTSTLTALDDVNINNPQNAQALVYDSETQKWVNGDGGSSALENLSDVDINTPQNDEALVYNSSTQKWENKEVQTGGGEWGTITGDISDQTDLQDALDEILTDIGDMSDLPTPTESIIDNIVDINSNLVDSQSFATSEKVVGTYSGKPLYRKVIQVSEQQQISKGSWHIVASDSTPVERIISFFVSNRASNTAFAFTFWVEKTSSGWGLYNPSDIPINVGPSDGTYIMAEYTKTTD